MKLLIIIPAYNESKTIADTFREVSSVLDDLTGYESDILVVDDASRDETGKAARACGATVVSLPVNLGIGGAVQAGYLYARDNAFDFALQIDGDGQHDPTDIPKLLNELRTRQVDMVIGSRFIGETVEYTPSRFRSYGMLFSRTLLKWGTKKSVYDTTSGFRVINRKLIDLFSEDYPRVFAGVVPLVIVAKNNYTFSEIKANFRYRQHGSSSINILKSFFYPFNITLAIVGVLLKG